MRTRFWPASALLLSALVACGGSAPARSSDGGAVRGKDGGTSDGDAAMVACGRWHDVFAKLASCDDSFNNGLSATERTLFVANCATAVKAPGSGLTIAFLNGCADASDRDPQLCTDWRAGAVTACVFPVGTRSVGAPCGTGFQCASGACNVVQNTQCGTCVALPTAGESCADRDCVAGLECLNSICVAVQTLARGAACSHQMAPGDQCAAGLTCIVGSGATTGTCQSVPAVGQACDGPCAGNAICDNSVCAAIAGLGASCAATDCVSSAYCDATQHCAPIIVGHAGDACDYNELVCGADLHCDATNVCRPYATIGQPCSDTGDIECHKELNCISGVCVVPDAAQCG